MSEPRALPHNLEAEKSVLGAVLIDNPCLKKVSGMLDGADFHLDKHRFIFHAMLQLQIAEKPIDLVALITELKAADKLEEIGGAAYLADLMDFVPTSANVGYYCKLMKESSTRRELITYGDSMIKFGYSKDDLAEGLKDAKADLASIMSNMDAIGGVKLEDITTIQDRAARYAVHAQQLDKSRFITGFPRLDHLIRGVAPGEVMTIIAEPGGFKTAWLQNLLIRGAKRTGLHHLFFSMEMPVEKVFEREAQIATGCIGREVEKIYKYADKGGRDDAKDMYLSTLRNGSNGLLVCDKPRLDIEKISRYTDLAANKYGKINAIGIDYLGLMAGPGRNLYEKMAFVAPEFKFLAKEMNVPVLILCQINREGAKNVNDILITDAKGGGDIEASADIMLGFYHDKNGVLVCKGLKNRNGANGWKLAARINKEAFQFQDMLEYEEPEEPKPLRKTGAVERRNPRNNDPDAPCPY